MEVSCEEKLEQITALIAKTNEALGGENEFFILIATVGMIDGILRGVFFYDPELDVGGLINVPPQKLDS